jgi:hypothetical protein
MPDEKLTLDPENWASYRSRMKCRAQRVAPEGARLGAPVQFPDAAGKMIKGRIGDWLVELDDGRIEFWAADHFAREMELEDEAPLTLEVPR